MLGGFTLGVLEVELSGLAVLGSEAVSDIEVWLPV